MAAAQQVRLLLWKDYLIRRRKPITLAGVVWAALVLMSLYIVRSNIDNVQHPTCQFAARALPSAGVLPFLQSFVCSVNNECEPLDQYEEIPAYENASFTQTYREISPLIDNATVTGTAATVPDALKLLATLADVADTPAFLHIVRKGLFVKDLFRSPTRVKRYLSQKLGVPEYVMGSVMDAEIGIDALFKGGIEVCDIGSMSRALKVKDGQHLQVLVGRLCEADAAVLQDLVMDLLFEMDLGKYVQMLGEMYYKLSEDYRLVRIAEMVAGALRMTSLDSFLPPELPMIFAGRDVDFSYINLTMITRLMEAFKPTFGETESYKSIREVADTTVIGMQYLSNFVKKSRTNTDDEDTEVKTSIRSQIKAQVGKIYQTVDSIGNAITDLIESDTFDIFKILPQVANIFIKWLSNDAKHEVILYSTMLAKLMQGAEKVVDININIEQWLYNASLRNPEGVKILLNLPPAVLGNGLEALADVDRAQIMATKLGNPRQMFCDTDRIEKFFLASHDTSTQLKTQLCTDAWANFTNDLLQSFGIKEVKNNINNMAAIFILEALGKDTTDYLYTIDKDFEVLKNFTTALTKMDRAEKPKLDWSKVLNVSKNSESMKVITEKARLSKHMLITMHGTFAKEVVTQNPLLSFKIATHLKKATVVIEALKEQLNTVPSNVTTRTKQLYPEILQTVIATARNEDKSYLSLSTPWDKIFCNGEDNASKYLEFGANVNRDNVSAALCHIAIVIENALTNKSIIAKTIEKLENMKEDTLDDVHWNRLITGLNELYGKLYNDYTYIFEYNSFGMDEALQKKMKMELKQAINFWFNIRNLDRLMHIVLKFGFRLLDVMDHAAFNMTHEIWLKLKYGLGIVEGPVQIAHDVISVISNTLTKTDVHSDMPPFTASLIQEIAPNVPKLVYDMADLITIHDLDIEPMITILNASPSWPCSVTSMYEILTFNKTSAKTLQSVEALSCFNSTLQEEWAKYTTYKNISTIKTWNSTIVYPDHVFLKFSATFDLFVKDLSSINSIIKETFLVDKDDDNTDFAAALEYIITAVNSTDRSHFRKLLTKVDKVMNIIDTPVLETNITLNKLWMKYFSCVDDEGFEQCRGLLRLSVVRSMHFVSMTFQAFSEDLHRYLTEANEPNASILKMLGFTSNTGMFMLYDRFGDFVSILVNSYLDLGFMSQVYRASQLEFWDCEDVTRSIRPGPGSAIDKAVIRQLEPFLCPSFFYWLSTPIGDNILLDIIAKPQFFLFKSNISSFSSAFEEAYNKAMDLTDYAKELSVNTNVFNEKITLDKMRGKMESTLDPIFTFKINKTDDSYVSFANVAETQTYATIYLTHIATVANKFADYIDKLNVTDVIDSLNATEEDARTITYELNIIKKIPIRNPHHFVAFHFDLITYMLWENNENYTILDALKYTCDSWKNKANNTNIVLDNDRIKAQICSKNYTILYEPASDMFNENTEKARNSLVNFVRVLNKDKPNTDVGEISEFLKSRTEVIDALQTSVNYAHDLKISVYLKYLHNNLRHYNVIVSFLSGSNWWSEFRSLYNTEAVVNEVLDTIENIFPIAEDIIANVDRIHIARLMHDINVNNTAKFCQANISVADYLPDNTRALRRLHRHICDTDRNEIITAIPPLHFAAQDFINQIKFSNEVDYDQVASDVDKISARIKDIEDGAKEPTRPQWITDYKLYSLREKMLQMITKESFTRISFGVISNFVDAGTLFLNSSRCTLCSKLTTWFKQINLQLYKKQEYDNLLCQMSDHITLEEIHNTLKYEFHWDMAFSELISTRNYTNYELNKSINEFLEQFKLHLLEDMTAGTTKITDCLAANATRNIFGNITLSARVLSSAAKLIRSQLAHLREVAGMTDVPFLQQLYADVAHNLQVQDAFNKYVLNNFTTHLSTLVRDQKLLASIENSRINLQAMPMQQPVQEYLTLEGDSWNDVCQKYNCSKLSYVISDNLNKTLIQNNLPKLQQQEFWQFNFISNIFYHVEVVLDHLARLMGVASQLDFEGVMAGNLTSLLDTGIQVMMDDSLNSLLYSIVGLLDELQVVLHNTTLEHDINAIAAGLTIIRDLKRYVIEQDMKVNLSQIFSNPEGIEKGLSQIGINNTNFWSIAAPRIHAGYIRLKPIFAPKSGKYQIKSFVCQVDKMASVIVPGNIDVVTVDDVYGAVADQLCGISDAQAKQMIPVLLENLNYTYIFGKLKANLLSKLYKVSNLTQEEGDEVFNKFGEMTEIIPTVQNKLGNVADSLSKEPLMMQLKRGGSFGDLLSGSDLLANTGKMMCGKPFRTELGRFYKAIVQLKDQNTKPDPAQLEIMPTDFCRDLYTQITSMDGGKIVWSYAKPLLFGKILYTPDVPVVKEIIQKANSTFAPMFKLVGIVHAFANTVPALEKLSDHRDGLKGLTDLLSSPQYSELLSNVIGNVTAPDVDVEKLFNSFGDINDITGMIKKASNMLRCFDLNRFRAVSNETELGHEAGKLTRVREFSAGLVFMNISEKDTKIPSNIEYKIRMDIENAPTTRRLKNFLWIPGPEANFLEDMRYFRGFIQIQDTIEKAIIELSINQSRKIQKRAAEGNEQTPMSLATYTQQTPYPCYIQDFFQTSLYASQALIVAFFFSLLLTVSSAVRFIVVDKETGNTMLMSVMGVNLSYHTLSWFVACALEMAVTVAVMTAVLYFGNVLPRTDPSLVFTLFLIYGCSALSFCYMISKLFSSASFAAVCTGIAFLCTFMPFVIILSLEAVLTNTLKVIVSLSSSSSVCYALLYLTRYEATSAGAGWPQVWDSPDGGDNMSIGIATCMIIFDTFLYFVIGLILDPFLGIRTESNITTCRAVDEKPGVSIVNVTKVYGNSRSGKLALDGVSMELVKGQITALLGHNGAGKTTLVRILTGMLKPTSGHVIVRSADGSRTTLGVCPQGDVLYEYMTAEEHVALYAQLKSGRPLSEVQDEVDSLLDVLSLGEARREAAARLSGGTRRRLCVALAFVARPHLVSLDEPTAGVDPAARRDIWTMITRLRADRTILLTTHHLDEAELLSDQIVIMHKGQIHTTGSPIEIKRSLGSGYKLTVSYPDTRSEEDSSEEGCLEEKTKNLLSTARSVVRNANLVDVNGLEVEINLPFYDQDGVSNDFPQLCCTLEEQQAALEFASYDMECSSLEQVFYNICHQADATAASAPPDNELSSKSASTSSVRSDRTPLVPTDGPLCASWTTQLAALLHIRFLHYTRNRWLLFLLVALPSIFVTLAMAFSTVRPPADIELSLRLDRHLYEPTTDFVVMNPSIQGDGDPTMAQKILDTLRLDTEFRNWTEKDSPVCKCMNTTQYCDVTEEPARPQTMVFPDVHTLNRWLVDSQQLYINKRYGGFSGAIRNGSTSLVAWYNNKGHHAMPAYVNALHAAARRALTGDAAADITLHTHPLKISEEQINKDTVYQHVADAGISAMLVVGYSLVSAGGAVYLVTARRSREKRLQLLAGVSPALYWAAALIWDLLMILVNIGISALILELFHFPVFVERNNLPAICILIFLYGYACSGLVHLLEKLFSEPSLANMMLFCGNCFVGLAGITVLLILDIISDSDATDNARRVLHKVFMLSPQFALADGLLEVAKNTIQSQVLGQFGLDTYRDPLWSDLLTLHLSALVVVGTALIALNLAVEYDCFDSLMQRFRRKRTAAHEYAIDSDEVRAEAERVRCSFEPLRLRTIGNINAGYVVTETDMDPAKTGSLKRWTTSSSLRSGAGAGPGALSAGGGDAAACVHLSRVYRTSDGHKHAVKDLTLGIPRGQCTALLGENGAGKSTTFAMLTGELRPTAGLIHLDGAPATPRDLCRGLISYCPQQDAIDPLLTVHETLRFYCRLRGIDNAKEVIKRTVEMFDLSKYTHVRSGALSGGNKRKLCTAIAFMGRTPLVLLDEPTSGMDPGSRGCVWRGVSAACGAGRAALLSTHALADARRTATRVALMRRARLQAVAPLDHCLKRFGGGWVCACRTAAGAARAAWRRIAVRAPASLQLLHDTALHVVLPEVATVEGKEVRTRLSAVFRLLSELQAAGLVRDYTVNRTDLDQMFLSYSDKQTVALEEWDGPHDDPHDGPRDGPHDGPHVRPRDGAYGARDDDDDVVTAL